MPTGNGLKMIHGTSLWYTIMPLKVFLDLEEDLFFTPPFLYLLNVKPYEFVAC